MTIAIRVAGTAFGCALLAALAACASDPVRPENAPTARLRLRVDETAPSFVGVRKVDLAECRMQKLASLSWPTVAEPGTGIERSPTAGGGPTANGAAPMQDVEVDADKRVTLLFWTSRQLGRNCHLYVSFRPEPNGRYEAVYHENPNACVASLDRIRVDGDGRQTRYAEPSFLKEDGRRCNR